MTTEKKPSEWATLMASALAVNHVCYHCDDALCEADSVGATKGIAEALEYAYQKGAEDMRERAIATTHRRFQRWCCAGTMRFIETDIRALPLREEKDDA